jgi:hypothetical protein
VIGGLAIAEQNLMPAALNTSAENFEIKPGFTLKK